MPSIALKLVERQSVCAGAGTRFLTSHPAVSDFSRASAPGKDKAGHGCRHVNSLHEIEPKLFVHAYDPQNRHVIATAPTAAASDLTGTTNFRVSCPV